MTISELISCEAEALAEHESVIERGLTTFVEVGTALLAIREERLYRAEHPTFEDYCRERWGMSKSHANRQIEAAQVAAEMAPIGVTPTTESQARELARVPDGRRAEVWRETVERTNGKPTAAAVRETYVPAPVAPPPEPTRPPISDEEIAELRTAERQPRPDPRPEPSPAVTELLESSEGLQRARYLHEFTRVLTRSDDFMEFDPAKLAEMADADLVQTIDDYAARVRNFADRFHRARPGLHVINGGSR